MRTQRGLVTEIDVALGWSCQNDHIPVAEYLLSRGANVNCRSNQDSTPLHRSARMGRAQMCRLLVGNKVMAASCLI